MPEITTLTVDPMQVRKGDHLDDATSADVVTGKTIYTNGHMVTEVKVGPSNTTLETTGGRVMIKNTGSAIIRREVPTEADRQAKELEMLEVMREDVVERVNKYAAGAARHRKAAAEKIAAADYTDHWAMDEFLAANAAVRVAGIVENIMDRARDQKLHIHEGECTMECNEESGRLECTITGRPTTEWDGVVQVFAVLTRRLMETATQRRVLSRSTSLTSNVMEDLEAEQLAHFFQEFRYGLAIGKLGLTSPYTVGADF